MRLLAAIPHYFRAAGTPSGDGRRHGSGGPDPGPRAAALSACIAALHRQFGPEQRIIHHTTRSTAAVNGTIGNTVRVVVCTAGDAHLLERLDLPDGSFRHHPTRADPLLLGFECQAALRDGLDSYDFFAYLEDDLICRDPWLFRKLAWFNAQVGDESLLQPNRFEVGPLSRVHKAYLDGDLNPRQTAPYQDLDEAPTLSFRLLGAPVVFHRPSNPHAGCYFLNAGQMRRWADRPHFLDRAVSFVGPLESAASLGILRTFRIYKPAPQNADFLEIEHHGTAFLDQLRPRPRAPAGPAATS